MSSPLNALAGIFRYQLLVDPAGRIVGASPYFQKEPFSITGTAPLLDIFACEQAQDFGLLTARLRQGLDISLTAPASGVRFTGVAVPAGDNWQLLLALTYVPEELISTAQLSIGDFGPFDSARQTHFLRQLHTGMEADLVETARELDAALKHSSEVQARTRDVCVFIAHDINNAASILDLCLGSLADLASLDPVLHRRVVAAQRALESIEQLSKSLDVLANMKSFSADTMLADAFIRENESLLQMAAGRRCRLLVTTNAPHEKIRVDPTGLIHALINLVFNSRDALSESAVGTIEIRTKTAMRGEERHLQISVTDSGPGVDESIQSRMFERKVTTKPGSGGSGLASVSSFCSSNGGTIEYHASPQGHPTFTLSFPVAAHDASVEVADQPRSEAQPDRTKVLIVEDEKDALDVVSEIVDQLGHDVQGAGSIWQAIRLLDAQPFDLVMLDAGMSRQSDVDLVQWVRLHSPATKVCEMSGSVSNFSRESAADWLVLKPLSIESIREIVTKLR